MIQPKRVASLTKTISDIVEHATLEKKLPTPHYPQGPNNRVVFVPRPIEEVEFIVNGVEAAFASMTAGMETVIKMDMTSRENFHKMLDEIIKAHSNSEI